MFNRTQTSNRSHAKWADEVPTPQPLPTPTSPPACATRVTAHSGHTAWNALPPPVTISQPQCDAHQTTSFPPVLLQIFIVCAHVTISILTCFPLSISVPNHVLPGRGGMYSPPHTQVQARGLQTPALQFRRTASLHPQSGAWSSRWPGAPGLAKNERRTGIWASGKGGNGPAGGGSGKCAARAPRSEEQRDTDGFWET